MQFLAIAQIVVSLLLVAAVLLQSQGAGLSSTFGGSDNAYLTRRGAEKVIFTATIVLGIAFLALGLLNVILR